MQLSFLLKTHKTHGPQTVKTILYTYGKHILLGHSQGMTLYLSVLSLLTVNIYMSKLFNQKLRLSPELQFFVPFSPTDSPQTYWEDALVPTFVSGVSVF